MRGFNFGRRSGSTVPRVQEIGYTTGQTFKKGAVVATVAAGTISEAGADPAAILGVAMEAAGSRPGYGVANESEVVHVQGRGQVVSVVLADRETEFHGRAVNGATDPVLPLQTHINEQYGISKVGDDWVIDMAKTGASARIQITDVRPTENLFLFKVLEANLERP
jgi:pyruvoyl-dependent arginine decarboxylase (PvlArgDC)